MFIYKITNKINNKVYIGQVYNKSIYDRFNRHIKEANINSKSYIGRAISKYGSENFVVEQIDEASSLKELNQKEIYWIKFYDSTDHNKGYNLTPGGDGGNTYLCKSEDEMRLIKEKISKANKGKNNGLSKQIKALNVETNEIIHFDCLTDACRHFNHKQKTTFMKHCENKAICLWRCKWVFAYEENEFNTNLPEKYDMSLNKGTKVKLIDLETNEEQTFNSLSKLNSYLGIHKGYLKFENNECIYDAQYRIVKL
jgi:hypothetical protein